MSSNNTDTKWLQLSSHQYLVVTIKMWFQNMSTDTLFCKFLQFSCNSKFRLTDVVYKKTSCGFNALQWQYTKYIMTSQAFWGLSRNKLYKVPVCHVIHLSWTVLDDLAPCRCCWSLTLCCGPNSAATFHVWSIIPHTRFMYMKTCTQNYEVPLRIQKHIRSKIVFSKSFTL